MKYADYRYGFVSTSPLVSPAPAHHSASMYDVETEITFGAMLVADDLDRDEGGDDRRQQMQPSDFLWLGEHKSRGATYSQGRSRAKISVVRVR